MLLASGTPCPRSDTNCGRAEVLLWQQALGLELPQSCTARAFAMHSHLCTWVHSFALTSSGSSDQHYWALTKRKKWFSPLVFANPTQILSHWLIDSFIQDTGLNRGNRAEWKQVFPSRDPTLEIPRAFSMALYATPSHSGPWRSSYSLNSYSSTLIRIFGWQEAESASSTLMVYLLKFGQDLRRKGTSTPWHDQR